ncbi:xylulokinase [Streptacidiphilus melanogenes]|uniref:xylulokinase n=1 Tax=Streptacidiphilus melanogenes TaxID=411235 RepID=UPI0005A79AEB|nr:FGGY family carbohydrate kinase [Streptacidiphilus melanogenes]
MTLVAGVDSSTQSCKVVIRDAETGALVRQGSAPHPPGTEVDPEAWWTALGRAAEAAGGLDDVAALSVAGQQHGMVSLDTDGTVVRPALLWNDTRSAGAADELVRELGPKVWAEAVGSVPVASFTVTKLRWLAEHEPEHAARVTAVCLPHDWLTWRLRGFGGSGPSGGPAARAAAGAGAGATVASGAGSGAGLDALTTDRSDASGTGYWSPRTGEYRQDLLALAFGRTPLLPRVLGPAQSPGPAAALRGDVLLGPGAGDNAAAALGLGARPGDVVVSIGTSGTVFAVCAAPTADPDGAIAGFADAAGAFLPLVCTLNAARVLDAAASTLDVNLAEVSRLALSAPPGADGLTLIPYLEGERTPNLPDAAGSLHGLRLANASPAHLARAYVEGMLCGLADGLDALTAAGVPIERVLLVGGGARSEAVRRIAPAILGRPVAVPPPGEYVADGAAVQAAWMLGGQSDPPRWGGAEVEVHEAAPARWIRERYRDHREGISSAIVGMK